MTRWKGGPRAYSAFRIFPNFSLPRVVQYDFRCIKASTRCHSRLGHAAVLSACISSEKGLKRGHTEFQHARRMWAQHGPQRLPAMYFIPSSVPDLVRPSNTGGAVTRTPSNSPAPCTWRGANGRHSPWPAPMQSTVLDTALMTARLGISCRRGRTSAYPAWEVAAFGLVLPTICNHVKLRLITPCLPGGSPSRGPF